MDNQDLRVVRMGVSYRIFYLEVLLIEHVTLIKRGPIGLC